jgi:hypothetical protein
MLKASLLLFLLPAAAVAQDHVLWQDGCQHYMTVQSRSCQVSHYFRCPGPSEGTQLRVDFGINGKSYEVLTDREGRWMQTYAHSTGDMLLLEEEAKDHASMTELLAGNRDSYTFSTVDQSGNRHLYEGEDRLTGETVLIDGETLNRTEFSYVETDASGTVVQRVEGREYISPSMRQFIGGITTFTDDIGSYPFDTTPRDFVRPGEPGFDSTIPQYECRDMMSSLFPLLGGAG